MKGKNNFLLELFKEYGDADSIIWKDKSYSYNYLTNSIDKYKKIIDEKRIPEGSVVAIIGDFSPNTIALLFTLIKKNFIIVPLSNSSNNNEEELFEIAKVQFVIRVNSNDEFNIQSLPDIESQNPFYSTIRKRRCPGLVLFTSGTSGAPKAAVHDLSVLLEKFKKRNKALRTLNFLMFDHWGGLNTMFYILSNGGTVIATKDRSPDSVCHLIEVHKIELLPASPTFLNLLLLSGAHNRYDLSSLIIISYGTEPMPATTLKKLNKTFPSVKMLQTYGLIELGVLRSKSKNNDSLWVKVGGEGYKTRIVDGILQIKARSAMLGYLNAPSPFTEDGWFITGDMVEVDGDYLKILGRKSEIINVGGEKVYPAEVENVILEMNNVEEVTVYGEKNSIMGNIVCAKLKQTQPEDKKEFISRLKKHCRTKLQAYKIPVKILISEEQQYSERYKKKRLLRVENDPTRY